MNATLDQSPNLYRSWLTIWYAPRQTIRRIVDSNPEFGIYPIATLSIYFSSGLFVRALRNVSSLSGVRGVDLFYQIFTMILALLICDVLGRIFLYTLGACIFWLGKAFGSPVSYRSSLGAAGWSLAPGLLAAMILVVVQLVGIAGLRWQFWFAVFLLALGWQAVILISGTAEIQGISIKAAAARVLLAILLQWALLAACFGLLSLALQLHY